MTAQLAQHNFSTVAEAARARGISPYCVWQRLHRGWTMDDALNRPVAAYAPRAARKITVGDVTDSITGWAGRTGITRIAITMRLRAGWDPALAVTTPKSTSWARQRAGAPRDYAMHERVHEMSLGEAKGIAFGSRVSQLGKTSKMPGYSYGIDAFQCITGSKLALVKGSTCEHCFARRNFYKTWLPVLLSRKRRQEAIDHPRWVDAMTRLIAYYCEAEPFFRWHDSGDLMSVRHLENIIAICRRTPAVKHWLPTREYGFVAEYLKADGTIPDNLCIRMSAHMVDQKPDFGELVQLRRLPTSTVHTGPRQVRVGRYRNDSIACRAPERDNQCGQCRACWTPGVRNVSYALH